MNRKSVALLVMATVVLVGFAFTSMVRDELILWSPGEYDVAGSYDRQLAQLKSALPAHGVVGYLGDRVLDNDIGTIRYYYVTQYALAPLIVVNLSGRPAAPLVECEFIVADFTDPEKARAAVARRGLSVVRDYGGGFMLLKKAAE